MIDDVKLEDFANNSFTQGYLKTWKAMGICRTVDSMKDVMQGERLQAYVRNSLEMEGFRTEDCDTIALWIEDQMEVVA